LIVMDYTGILFNCIPIKNTPKKDAMGNFWETPGSVSKEFSSRQHLFFTLNAIFTIW
jgi:hypothetical protein